jgi:hypothetical protein
MRLQRWQACRCLPWWQQRTLGHGCNSVMRKWTLTAGSALAITAFQTSAAGRQTAIQTNLGNTAVELGDVSLAQSRTAVLATATGNASIATNSFNQSLAGGQNPTQSAIASTAGLARGDTVVMQSVGVTTAVSSGLSGYGSIGFCRVLGQRYYVQRQRNIALIGGSSPLR